MERDKVREWESKKKSRQDYVFSILFWYWYSVQILRALTAHSSMFSMWFRIPIAYNWVAASVLLWCWIFFFFIFVLLFVLYLSVIKQEANTEIHTCQNIRNIQTSYINLIYKFSVTDWVVIFFSFFFLL